MSGSWNQATICGNIGKEPEIRQTKSGNAIASFSIATSETWNDKATGEKREATEWHNIVCFNEGLVRVIENYVHKGDKVLVQGKIKTRKWQDVHGNDRYSTEIVLQGFDAKLVMLGSKGDRQAAGAAQGENFAKPQNYGGDQSELDDEVPF